VDLQIIQKNRVAVRCGHIIHFSCIHLVNGMVGKSLALHIAEAQKNNCTFRSRCSILMHYLQNKPHFARNLIDTYKKSQTVKISQKLGRISKILTLWFYIPSNVLHLRIKKWWCDVGKLLKKIAFRTEKRLKCQSEAEN
jgi:hypothetical protein